MSCIIIYKDNRPVGVEDSEGNSSKLFQDILSNPHVADFNAALEIYQNIYSDKIKLEEVERLPVIEEESSSIISNTIAKLKETGLAGEVYQLSNQEIQDKLQELGVSEGKSTKGYVATTAGFVYEGDVYLNMDELSLDTPIHEFGHLYLNKLKGDNNTFQLFLQGINLAKSKDAKAYQDYVKKTQPDLKVGSITFYEEVLAQAVGDAGAKFLEGKDKNTFLNWIEETWAALKDVMGLTEYFNNESLKDITFGEFTQAIAKDLISGTSIEGLLNSQPNSTSGTFLTINNEKGFSDAKGITLADYNADFIDTSVPVKTLAEVVKEYEGRVLFITSDYTGIGTDKDGDLIEGGAGYMYIKKNVDDKIGFASLDDVTAKSSITRAANLYGEGKKVAVMVVVQTPSSTLGNYYGAKYLGRGLRTLQDTLSAEEYSDIIASIEKVILTNGAVSSAIKKFENNPKKGYPIQQPLLELLENVEKYSPKEFAEEFSKDTTFDIRRTLVKILFSDNKNSKINKATHLAKAALQKAGFTKEDFLQEYGDSTLLTPQIIKEDKGGNIVGGFGITTTLNSEEEITNTEGRGIKHPLFNGKVPSNGEVFVLDNSYGVADNFTNYVKPQTIFNEDYRKEVDRLFKTFAKNNNSKAKSYKDLSPSQSIKFKEFVNAKNANYLALRPSTVNSQIAQGLGISIQDREREQLVKKAEGIQFSKKEPNLVYRDSKGSMNNSMQEAIKNTPEGSISLGIETQDGFKELAAIEASTNINTKEGIINSLVKDNLLSGETFIDTNGKKIYKIKGNDKAKKAINSDLAVASIRERLGIKSVKALTNGDIVFDDNHTKRQITITKKDGSPEYITPEDLSNKPFSQLKRENEDAVAIMAIRDFKSNMSVYGEKVEEEVPFIPENELQLKLVTLLKSMGVKTTSIADYLTRVTVKNGVEPSAQALADLANNIIAFKDGVVNAEDLLEETAHFIIAQTSEEEKTDLKRNIHKTPEWVEFQASYREIYSQEYSGEELEDIVREEILGKVLKNAINNRFKAETEGQQNFYNKVLEFFKNFFTRVETYFTESSQKQLNKFTSAVYENLMSDNLSGMLTGENNRNYTLYSTTNNTNPSLTVQYKQAVELLERLTQQQRELSKKYNSPGSSNLLGAAKARMEDLETQVDDVSRVKALLHLARVANSQINTLTKVVDKNLEGGYHFSQEENSVYQSFITKLEPLLAQVNAQLTGSTKEERQVKAEIEAVLRKSIELKGKTPLINEAALDAMLDRIANKNSLTDEEKEKYKAEIKAVMNVAQKDTQFFHAYLGSLSNAKNGFLNLAGDVIERVQYTERSLYLPRIKQFLTDMNAIGFDTRNLKKFIRNGYIINEINAEKEEIADLEDRAESFNKADLGAAVSGLGDATKDDVLEKLQKVDEEIKKLETTKSDKALLSLLVQSRQDYARKYKMQKSRRRETYYTKEYIEEMEAAFVTVNGNNIAKKDLPESSREVDKFYRSQITQIRLNAENGILTASDAEEIREINRQRQQDSFPRDTEGNLKKGLKETYNDVLGRYVVEIDNSVILDSSESRERDVVYGLQMIGLINQEFYKNKPGMMSQDKFIDALEALSSEQEKWEFLQTNSYIGFEDTFWDNFKPEESLLNRLRAAGYGQGQDNIVDEIRAQQQIIANVLKQNRKFNSPAETDMSVSTGMSQTEVDTIKNASSILENILSKARGLIKDEVEPNLEIESRTNESYSESLEDLGIKTVEEEIKFISTHVTASNAGYIESARKIAESLKRGEDVNLNKTFSKVFNKNMSEDEISKALLGYAKSKLLPYFKRTEPTGYSEKLEAFKQAVASNTPGVVRELVEGTSPLSSNLKVSPSFTFFESTQGVNPRWLSNKALKRDQYSKEWLDRVRDDEYYSYFGVDKDTGVRTSNLNENDWKARETLLSLQDWTINNYGLEGTHNRYLLPQQHKNAVERGVKGFKQDVKDFVNYREDELELGQLDTGEAAKKGSTLLTIPTYGIFKLKEQEDVSTQLLESYSWMAQQSALHRARKENISDMLVLNDLILNPGKGYIGKEAEATATYTMFKSFLHANFYGVKESISYETTIAGKRVDIGKIAKSFNNWVRFSNLAGVTVPITSAITGKVAEFVEKVVGEAINPMAYNKAHKEFVRTSSEAAREIGGFTSNARLNVILEAIGVYNVNERFTNSNYNKATRVGLKASSGLHSIGNFPVTATTGLSVIYDYKYYGDDIVTFDQFKRKNPTKSASELKDEWSKLGEFYSDWKVNDGVLSFDKASIQTKINVANLDELLKLKMEAISSRTAAVIQRVDAQVPEHQRSVASRNAFANFFMMHLNWFLIQTQLKLKDRHYNISEDTYQEGNWRTAYKFLESGLMNPKDIKRIWKESMADELTRKNLKRTVVELSLANALAVGAMLLANYVDDEEDPSWFLAWSDYLMTRASVEQISGTVALPKQVGELLTNPLVSSQKFYDLFNILDVFSSEETKTGVNAGETARMKWARKNLPWIRDYTRLKDPKAAADTYTYFAVEKPNLYDDWAWLSNAFDEE